MVFVEIDSKDLSLPDLLREVAAGEEVVITANGIPQARLVNIPQPHDGKRQLGQLAGKFKLPDDFDDPLPDDIMAAFEGR